MWIVGWVPRILVGNLKFFECIEREGDGGNDDERDAYCSHYLLSTWDVWNLKNKIKIKINNKIKLGQINE